MFNPKNIPDPPTRERVAVESSTTKHTIVLKPGFQNRRNRSEYLKNSFPAGFLVKNKLTEKLGESILRDNLAAPRVNPYGSFTEWTKGEPEEPIDNVSLDLTDPYADVAGPFLEDMLRNRNMVQKPLPDNTSQFNSVIVRELPLHNRAQRHAQPKKSTSNSPTKPQVFNAPALMPNFTPALGQNKINNNLLPVNPSEYEQWLSTQRSGIAEKAWLTKGNAEGFNYSAYEFGGERSPSLILSTTGYEDASLHSQGNLFHNMLSIDTSSPHPSSPPPMHASATASQLYMPSASYSTLLTTVPAPLPERILLEVHTVNQMIRTDKLEEDKHIMRSIDSHVTLSELKGLITEDIIQGIERAFRLYSDSVQPSQRHEKMNYTRVELHFQCFVPLVGAWRAMATETDWTLAKQNCRNEQNIIKLMYALEKNSEFLLLQEIQQSYQKQRQKANLQSAPQISLQSLTESMEKSLRLKKKYIYNDSPPLTTASTHRPAAATAQLGASKSVNFLPQARSITMPVRSQASSLGRHGSTSIHALLDSLNKTDPFREEHRLGHANGMNDSTYSNGGLNANSLLGGSSMYTSSVPSSASSAANGGVLGASRSIFYPKRSHTLDKMYEELESSMPRQQNFANNLEQRLFKTKW